MGKLKISTKNPRLVLDEYGNEFMEFKGDFYDDLLKFIDKYNYTRHSVNK
jgi:hypothetical protein